MLKILFPLLLASTVAFPAEVPKGKGAEFSSPYTVQGPKETTVTKNMNAGKCTLGASMLDELHSAGFQGLIQFIDGTNPKIVRVTMFDAGSNQMAEISLVYDRPANEDGVKKEDIQKVCVEYVGNTPYARGDTLKSFIFHQNMDWTQRELDAGQEEEKARRLKEHEPYQGDQNHA